MVIIFCVFLVALILRISLSFMGFHVDILSNAGWGQWIYENGTMGFYDNNKWLYAWPTQPPLASLIYGLDRWIYQYLLEFFRSTGNIIVKYRLDPSYMLWWFEFIKWFDTGKTSPVAAFPTGYLAAIKLLPIAADLGIAGIIYRVSKSVNNKFNPLLMAGVYLFSPFSFYLSALWGQYDQLAFLPIIAAFILESYKKYPVISLFLFSLSIAIKPTGLILVPLFLYLYFKNRHRKMYVLTGFILVILFYILTIIPFTEKNIFLAIYELYEKIFLKAATRLSANAFNFWRILQSDVIETQESKIFFIPAYIWSFAAYIYLNITAFKILKTFSLKNVFASIFVVSAGSFLFMTNMLDRYFFAGIVSGLIVSIYYPRLLKYWLLMSLIFAVNLYNQWWFPPEFDLMKKTLEWNSSIVTKFLAFANIFLYLKMFRRLV